MIRPIVLNEFDETLIGDGNRDISDETTLIFSRVGVHAECHGFINLIPVSETYSVLYCQHCGLRIIIPRKIGTYGDLRKWCVENLMMIKERRRLLADIVEERDVSRIR